MILRARSIVTMDGPPIENGAVTISGERISAVGRWADIRRSASGEAVDLGECVLLPGLINAHCHLDYTMLRGAIARPATFTGWIQEINARKAALTEVDYLQSISDGFGEAADFGTTTLVNLEGFPHLLSAVSPPPMRTWWLAEMIDVRESQAPAEIVDRMRDVLAQKDQRQTRIGLAPHAPFTASTNLYREASRIAARLRLPLTTHLAESREEMEMFLHATGDLFAFMSSIGRPMRDCGATTPLGLMLHHRLLDERWIVAHLNELAPEDFHLLENAPRFHIVHCPRSHAYFGHSPFAWSELRARGFNICLGTDSLASNEDLSLFAEMRQMSRREPHLSAQALLEMVTVNAAAALGQAGALGRVHAGFLADLISVPWHGLEGDTLDQVLAYDEKVRWMMLGGRVVRQN